MPLTTVPVHISTQDIAGHALGGGLAKFTLNAPDVENGIIVTPRPLSVPFDANGNADTALWPNALGSGNTRYHVAFQDTYGRVLLESLCLIPNTPAGVALASVLTLAPPPILSDAQVALQQAQAAAATASQAAQNALTAAQQAQAAAASVLVPQQGYVHLQGVASTLWMVHHNLGKLPSVAVEDSTGTDCEGEVTYLDNNTLQIEFSAGFSGRAIIN